jgi:hypothetical protein
MEELVFWLWGPSALLFVMGFGLLLMRHDRKHSGK